MPVTIYFFMDHVAAKKLSEITNVGLTTLIVTRDTDEELREEFDRICEVAARNPLVDFRIWLNEGVFTNRTRSTPPNLRVSRTRIFYEIICRQTKIIILPVGVNVTKIVLNMRTQHHKRRISGKIWAENKKIQRG